MDSQHSQQKFDKLRKLAEEILKQRDRHTQDVPQNLTKLVHELEVHQIELETQHRELERTHEQLEAAHHEYEDLFDFAPVGYIICQQIANDSFEVMNANLTITKMLGLEKTDLIGAMFIDFVHSDYRNQYYLHERAILRTEQPQHSTVLLQHESGSTFFVQLSSDLRHAGNKILYRTAITNIDAIKRAETSMQTYLHREQELNELKTRLISVISHEFRTPLSVIMTTLELLEHFRDQLTTDELAQQFNTIRNHLWHLNGLVNDIVVAQQTSGKDSSIMPTSFDAVAYIHQVIEDLHKLHPEERLQLNLQDCRPQEPVTWDQRLLNRIMINLLENALKYSSATVECRVVAEAEWVTLAIQDKGHGIPPDDQKHIFDMFYRGSNVQSESGTGVGLSIAKLAAEAHNGDIRFTTSPRGTTFFVTLPRHSPM